MGKQGKLGSMAYLELLELISTNEVPWGRRPKHYRNQVVWERQRGCNEKNRRSWFPSHKKQMCVGHLPNPRKGWSWLLNQSHIISITYTSLLYVLHSCHALSLCLSLSKFLYEIMAMERVFECTCLRFKKSYWTEPVAHSLSHVLRENII